MSKIFTMTIIAIIIGSGSLYGGGSGKAFLKVIKTNVGEKGLPVEISFLEGKSFKNPTFSFWIEDVDGKYIETLYVTNYLATGIFKHSKLAEGYRYSKKGPAKRPSSLPYWLHKRNIRADGITYLPTPDKPVPDAITGATPTNNFKLESVIKSQLPRKFKILMEINQPFDNNDFWSKEKFPDEFDYSYSAQPALVYCAEVDLDKPQNEYTLMLIGHSHYSGKTGELFPDLSTITTARNMVKEVIFHLK